MGVYTTTTAMEILMIGTEFDTLTTALCTKMITHAENEVNKFLSKRYDLATFASDVPPIVESLAETLAEGYMYMRSSRGGKESLSRGQAMVKMALDNLKLIADYKLDVIGDDGLPIPDSVNNTAFRVLSSTTDYSPTFNEDNELNWGVDNQKLNDIADDREVNK